MSPGFRPVDIALLEDMVDESLSYPCLLSGDGGLDMFCEILMKH